MDFMNNNYQKVNTFSRKIQMSQMFTYCLILTQLIIFLSVIQINYVSISSKIVMNFFVILSFVILVITCFKCSSIDPVDPTVLQYRNGDPHKLSAEIGSLLYCDACNSYVKKTSKHCKLCDRCVQNFDHHCNWINNCIGTDNYYWFFVMIIAAFSYMLFYCISLGLLYQEQNWSAFMAGMMVAWVVFGITLPFSVLLFILVCFHINLLRLGISTYDFIMNSRAGDQKKIPQNEEPNTKITNKTQQDIVIGSHKQDGNTGTKNTDNNKPIIFQMSEDNSQVQIRKKDKKSSNKVPSTQAQKYGEQQNSNEKEIRDYFKKYKSMKFLIGQSFLVQNRTQMSYYTRKNTKEVQKAGEQKVYRSLKYQ